MIPHKWGHYPHNSPLTRLVYIILYGNARRSFPRKRPQKRYFFPENRRKHDVLKTDVRWHGVQKTGRHNILCLPVFCTTRCYLLVESVEMQVKNLSILNKCSRGAAGRHPIAPERLFPAQGLEWGRRGNAAAGTLPAQCGEGGGAAAWGDNAGGRRSGAADTTGRRRCCSRRTGQARRRCGSARRAGPASAPDWRRGSGRGTPAPR